MILYKCGHCNGEFAADGYEPTHCALCKATAAWLTKDLDCLLLDEKDLEFLKACGLTLK